MPPSGSATAAEFHKQLSLPVGGRLFSEEQSHFPEALPEELPALPKSFSEGELKVEAGCHPDGGTRVRAAPTKPQGQGQGQSTLDAWGKEGSHATEMSSGQQRTGEAFYSQKVLTPTFS